MAIYSYTKAQEAPIENKGIIYWFRCNLFSNLFNTILTLVGIYFLYLIIPPLLNWLIFDATWTGTKEEIVKSGARWIFIEEKWRQFMYGFYPQELQWRPNFVLILSFILFFGFKFIPTIKQKIAVIIIYPVICFFLISGGVFGLEVVETEKWGGLMLTLIVSSVGIVASFPIGIVLALGRQSKLPIFRTLSVVFIEFARGVPLITVLFMASVVLPLFFSHGMDFNKLLRALIGITLFQAAYVAEIVRGGLQAIPKGQYEGADSIGLGYWQSMILVILPQALKISIPNLVGTFIELFKDTSLVLIIGLFDVLAMVGLTTSDSYWLGYTMEGYAFVTMIYWFFCFSMSSYAKAIERKYHTGY